MCTCTRLPTKCSLWTKPLHAMLGNGSTVIRPRMPQLSAPTHHGCSGGRSDRSSCAECNLLWDAVSFGREPDIHNHCRGSVGRCVSQCYNRSSATTIYSGAASLELRHSWRSTSTSRCLPTTLLLTRPSPSRGPQRPYGSRGNTTRNHLLAMRATRAHTQYMSKSLRML